MDNRQRFAEDGSNTGVRGGAAVQAVDPNAVPEGTGTEVEELYDENGKPIRNDVEEYINIDASVADINAADVPQSARAAIISRLPDSWTQSEINHFIETYYGKVPEEVYATHEEAVETVEELVEEVSEPESYPISSQSRKGLTLDSTIIIDGRSVRVRDIADAGQLMPVRTYITEGTRRFPRKAVLYAARVIDRPRTLIITEETYKVLSDTYPNVTPHDEPLTAQGIKNVQAKPSVLKADNMERVLPNV